MVEFIFTYMQKKDFAYILAFILLFCCLIWFHHFRIIAVGWNFPVHLIFFLYHDWLICFMLNYFSIYSTCQVNLVWATCIRGPCDRCGANLTDLVKYRLLSEGSLRLVCCAPILVQCMLMLIVRLLSQCTVPLLWMLFHALICVI